MSEIRHSRCSGCEPAPLIADSFEHRDHLLLPPRRDVAVKRIELIRVIINGKSKWPGSVKIEDKLIALARRPYLAAVMSVSGIEKPRPPI